MFNFIAGGALVVVWCLLLVWIARTAQSRGRSALVWSLIGTVASALGVITGIELAGRMVEGDEVGNVKIALSMFMPLVGVVAPMLGIGYMVQREPIKITTRGAWPVSFLGKGKGSITVDGSKIRIQVGETSRELSPSELSKVEADGECVRITLTDDELLAMPMGKPATPAGRKHQSLILARQLRARPS